MGSFPLAINPSHDVSWELFPVAKQWLNSFTFLNHRHHARVICVYVHVDSLMDFSNGFASAQDDISQALVGTTRSATQLSAEDLPFHRSLNPKVASSLDAQSSRLLSIAQRLLRRSASSRSGDPFELTDAESIDSNWRSLVDAADSLLERTDTCLDEFNGLVKQATSQEDAPSPAPSRHTRKPNTYHPTNLPKPQLLFETKPENTTTSPFRPFLTLKPHAAIPLDKSLALRPNEQGTPQYLHPYATEISSYEYPSFVYTRSNPTLYTPFSTTTATFVNDLEDVYPMLQELKKAPVIAIDLEHHDTHSYIGIVSLMQISTRDHDWIVDTLRPWRRKLEVLNEVFADPSILKVLHGAHMDIMWLQRDLGLYVVGLFDTHHASRVLGYPAGSLAYLLKHFVDFDAQKQFQTADWRMRPLPPDMFDYARSDTHFLLYVFDNMRNELVERSNFDNYDKDKAQAVLERSKETALQRYEYSAYDVKKGQGANGWFNSLQRAPVMFSKEQFAVYRRVHQWRDTVARQEDESPHQILTKQALMNISQALPRDIPSLLRFSHPISQPVRVWASELLETIKDAISTAPDQPEMHSLMSDISKDVGFHVPRQFQHATARRDTIVASNDPVEASQVDEGDARSSTSQLWGGILSISHAKPVLPPQSLPHFPITPSILHGAIRDFPSTPDDLATKSGTSINGETSAAPRLISAPNTKSNKRKREETTIDDAALAEQQDSIPIPAAAASKDVVDDYESEASVRKMQRKVEKKAAKAARKSQAAITSGSTEQPFDYSTAPSILNATATIDRGARKDRQHKHFDPYKKAMDAPSGVKTPYAPKAGKSHTFKK